MDVEVLTKRLRTYNIGVMTPSEEWMSVRCRISMGGAYKRRIQSQRQHWLLPTLKELSWAVMEKRRSNESHTGGRQTNLSSETAASWSVVYGNTYGLPMKAIWFQSKERRENPIPLRYLKMGDKWKYFNAQGRTHPNMELIFFWGSDQVLSRQWREAELTTLPGAIQHT